MTDAEVDEVLNALDELWPSRSPLSDGARAMWGAELVRHDRVDVLRALQSLLQTSKWRPQPSEILERMRERRKRAALAESKEADRLALAAPRPPALTTEEFAQRIPAGDRAMLRRVLDATKPTNLGNLAAAEPQRAVGGVAERRRWGAFTLQVVTELLMLGDDPNVLPPEALFAADVLDEVKRRASA